MTEAVHYLLARGDALRLPLPDRSVDLVFGSPPYVDARLYLENGVDLGISRGCIDWVDWMLAVTAECLRVSRGAVVWVASGVTRDRTYWPACEGLMWEWYRRGGSAYRPCYWHRHGTPGSGGDQWFKANIEHCMCFKRPGVLPWSDNTVMGRPPRFGPGGEMSHRLTDGTRVNQWGGRSTSGGGRRPDGSIQRCGRPSHKSFSIGNSRRTYDKVRTERAEDRPGYEPPALANPGNLIDTGAAGGNHLGSEFSHQNEAPFPEALAEFFVRSLVPPGGIVLDPFSGSGTTAAAAARLDRRGVGIDLRQSQCELGARRIAAGLRPVSKLDPKPVAPLAGQQSLFAV